MKSCHGMAKSPALSRERWTCSTPSTLLRLARPASKLTPPERGAPRSEKRPRKAAICAFTTSGCSMLRRCAARGTMTISASGMRERMSSIMATGVAGSSAPARMRIGVRMAAIAGRRSMSRIASQQIA
jgi:hypothetical protein